MMTECTEPASACWFTWGSLSFLRTY